MTTAMAAMTRTAAAAMPATTRRTGAARGVGRAVGPRRHGRRQHSHQRQHQHRLRALNARDDVVIVTGALERLAQSCCVLLRENQKSADVAVVSAMPKEAFEGVKNPRDVRATELVYPNENTLGMLRDAGVGLLNCDDEKATKDALARATCVIFAEETPKRLRLRVEETMARVDKGEAPRLRRVVLLSRTGVERRDVDPWKYMNRKTFRGGAPLDDAWAAEEAIRTRAAKNVNAGGKADGFTFTIVRTGELRGNGPTSVVYGDYALTLVDNAFDVRMQDIDVEKGDTFGNDFTKRLSAAGFANRMLTTSRYDVLNAAFSIISTGPVPRERRMGYDVAKGKSPPPISDREIDEQLAPDDGEVERAPDAAPVPT